MKIIYAPEYDGENHLPLSADCPCLLNTLYTGNIGLLTQLELRLGLSPVTVSEVEREALYLLPLRKYHKNAFYEKAAEHDELGTAHQLLKWRDALVMAGWNKDCKTTSDKLNQLALLDTEFDCPGMADRWATLLKFAETHSPSIPDLQIQVDCPENGLPALIAKTLQVLKQHGLELTFTDTFSCSAKTGTDLWLFQQHLTGHAVNKPFTHDGSLRILSFPNVNDTYEWFATHQHAQGSVAICNNREMLNHMLSSWNQPLPQATSSNSNPQIIQLFKLGLSLFERPLNVYNLLSYLQMPMHPLPAKLRSQLAAVLCNEGGINKKWEEILNNYVFDEDEKEHKKKKKNKAVFWEIVTLKEVGIEDIAGFNHALLNWANALVCMDATDEMTHHQLLTLVSFCRAFDTVITGLDRINDQQLNELTRSIYRPTSYPLQSSQQGCRTTLTDIGQLASSAPHLIWLDCNNSPALPDSFAFLSIKEKEELAALGIHIPEYTSALLQQRYAMSRSICNVQHSLTLVTATYDGNQQTNEHPVISELSMVMDKDFRIDSSDDNMYLRCKEERPLDNRQPQTYYKIPKLNLPTRKQSYTSLETLIQRPFDYVTQYVADLNEPGTSEMKNLNLTKGLVAHLFIQQLTADGENQLPLMQKLFNKEFLQRAERAITEKGAILLLRENHIEKRTFISQLQKSIETLLNIMERHHLRPVGCEVNLDIEKFFDYGSLGGQIDCLLQNPKDEYVIFDFKWSNNEAKYIKALKEHQALQLELYKWAIEKEYGKVAAVAYYLFPKYLLLSCDLHDNSDEHVRQIVPDMETIPFIEQLCKSIDYRIHELSEGILEEAEGFPLEDISYARDSVTQNLNTLEENRNHSNCKNAATVFAPLRNKSDKPTLLETPTHHSILKARLK